MKKYYIHNDNTPLGPFTLEELKNMEITKYTPVWYESLNVWTPAAQVKELETLWAEDESPFIHYPAPPPSFDQDAYDKKLQDGFTPEMEPPTPAKYGRPVFWIVLAAMVLTIGTLLAYRYHKRTVDQTMLAALEQKKWEDSLAQQTDTLQTQFADSQTTEVQYDRTENAKNYARMNIERFVRCTKSFTAKPLGGITNVNVVFYNNSDFMIDRADIRLSYIKSNGGVFTTHTVSVSNVPPHSKREVRGPDEKRGVDLRASLTKLNSNALLLAKHMNVGF